MSVFVVIPFMELLLPVALKIFPNMLPSTFEDSLQKEDAMKRELQMRLAMAGFMKDMLREMAKDVAKKGTEASAAEVTSFVEKAKLGNMVNEDIFKFAKVFRDDLTLDNMSRTQLVTMCTFMNIQPYGADAFIRFKLRSHIRDIQVLVFHTSHVDVDIFNMYVCIYLFSPKSKFYLIVFITMTALYIYYEPYPCTRMTISASCLKALSH
jgi:hypothetical protein